MENIVISVSLPKQLVDDADVRAKLEYKNRSEYIKDLIVADINQPKLAL